MDSPSSGSKSLDRVGRLEAPLTPVSSVGEKKQSSSSFNFGRQCMAVRVSATRRLQFSAGHRVFQHESKCANIHGHNYVVLLHAEADRLDKIGRVIDFSVLKAKFGTWIEDWWDHGMIYWERDTE